MRTLRSVVVWLLPVLVLIACDTGTEPELAEVESYEFSATVERFGLSLFLAHHERGAALGPENFFWPTSDFGQTARWEADSSPAHSLGPSMGFGGLHPGEKFVLEYRVEWVNGETLRPFAFRSMVAVKMERVEEKAGPILVKVDAPFTFGQIGPTQYRVEITVPAAPSNYSLSVVPGLTLECNAEGTKSLLLRDISFSGAGFGPARLEGTALFTGTCRRPLPRYSRAG